MGGVQVFNAIEAGWWALVALAICFLPIPAKARWARLPLAAALLLFGVSDVVEIRTGAWWRPWWLAVWKGVCVLAIVALGSVVVREWRRC